MKVLLADDSRTIRLILRNLLSELRINDVTEAANGREALAALAAGRFELILLDIHMPELDGLGVLEAIKTPPDSAHRHVPVVIISSDTDYRQIERARELGAYGYIKKPFKKDGLEAAIAAARESAAAAAPPPAPAVPPSRPAVVLRPRPPEPGNPPPPPLTTSSAGPPPAAVGDVHRPLPLSRREHPAVPVTAPVSAPGYQPVSPLGGLRRSR